MKSDISSLRYVAGDALSFVLFFLNMFLTFTPVFYLGFPFWLAIVAIVALCAVSTVPILGSLANIAVWIWALVVCLGSSLTAPIVIFYILFGLNVLNVTQAVIRTFFIK